MIKKDNADGGVGASPRTTNDITPSKRNWTFAICVAALVIAIIICAIV